MIDSWLQYNSKLLLAALLLVGLTACAQDEVRPEVQIKYEKIPYLGVDGRYMMHHREVGPFHPEDVSCADKTTQEQKDKWESFRNHPDGDLFLLGRIDELLPIARDMANQGDPVGMYAFGSLKREILSMEYSKHMSREEYRILPDNEKQDMVTALTYIYISEDIKDLGQRKDHGVLSRLEKGGFKDIPSEWIAEAKENAARWSKHCESGAQ
jgi:hypothetical protein